MPVMIDIYLTLAAVMAVASPSVMSHTGAPAIGVPAESMSNEVVVYGTPPPTHVAIIAEAIESPPIDPRDLTVDRDGKGVRRPRNDKGSDVTSGSLDAEMRNARELIKR